VPAPSIEPAETLPSPSGPEVPEKLTIPPALVMKRALPPSLLLVNCVIALLLVVMVALPAVLVSENEMRLPEPLLMMVELPAELEPRKDMLPLLVIAAFAAVPLLKNIRKLLVKLGADTEPLAIPAPLMLKVVTGLMVNEYAGAAAVNWIVLIEVELEMVTDVGVPGLFVNVAMSSGTVLGVGVEFQFVPTVHSLPKGPPPAEPGAVNRVRRTRRQHEPDAAEQRRAAEGGARGRWRDPDRAIARCGARRSRCRGARCLQTPPI
jgi:hypothetical protein